MKKRHFQGFGYRFWTRNSCGPQELIVAEKPERLSLSNTRVGRIYILIGCEAGRQMKEKVYSMGLNSGARLKITNNSGHGPVGLEVRQTRLGIGRGMASKIWVREVEP